MEADIRKLAKRRNGEDSDDEPAKKKAKNKSYLAEELARYSKGRGLHKKDKKKDESDVLAAMTSFRSKLKKTSLDDLEGDGALPQNDTAEAGVVGDAEDPGIEVDDDRGFMSHLLSFPKGNDEEVQKAERDYEVIDPRQRGARAREEERERKKAMKPRDGGRGSRR